MITDHAEAVLALFDGFPHVVYDGAVPAVPEFPYAVVFMDTGVESATKLSSKTDRAEFRFQVTSVGLSAASARIVADAARSRVLDVRLTVADRVCNPIRHETSIPVRPDRDVTDPETNRHPMFAVDTYRVPSHAA